MEVLDQLRVVFISAQIPVIVIGDEVAHLATRIRCIATVMRRNRLGMTSANVSKLPIALSSSACTQASERLLECSSWVDEGP